MVRQKWRGIIKGGTVALEEPIPLPDGTPVIVVPEEEEGRKPDWENDPFLKVVMQKRGIRQAFTSDRHFV